MSSFDEKLETLDVPHRFIEREVLAQFRRDSTTSRYKQDPNPFFLYKRERLESGESLFFPQPTGDKRDLAHSFNLLNSCEKGERRRLSVNNQSEFSLANLEYPDPKAVEKMCQPEEESVIDQKLTIAKVETARLSTMETEIGVSEKDEVVKEEPRFVIKVKKTDSRLEISRNGSFDNDYEQNIDDIDIGLTEEGRDDKGNNLIFGDEPSRLAAKIAKVVQYWNKSSLLIPNVFRLLKDFEDDKDNLLEFQDYSKKELLVQSNGMKFKPSKDKGLKKVKKTSEVGVKKVSSRD